MSTYEAQRLANIKRNQALLNDLGIDRTSRAPPSRPSSSSKRKKLPAPPPSRASARLASALSKPSYTETDDSSRAPKRIKTASTATHLRQSPSPEAPPRPKRDIHSLEEENWYSWTRSAEPPTRDEDGTFRFPSHPRFTPNKSPLEILAEGAFGGSYYRPLRSRTLGVTIGDDWEKLPADWLAGLDVGRLLTRDEYDPATNKFGVKCGQSIEEWEASGWINAEWDVRGWFQWYERFFRGRRGEDDERQVGRWERCVGERGRWRRALVKAYLKKGVRNVADEGVEEEEVSPVLCQTCHHWAWEMRQEYLDRVWEEGL
ncbi:hypothetical protein K461DRAFT_238016 [Myriangium duriaei CBS 260.36]|uniref:Uncharacterized protein n=1 Tax=Myriangium duriaei CBS 260.36 TaxID=1168546 RepID=A0A9P4J4G8_9PEZI|nr:hypothetical protein K461DRAFT_238016 [Myriangium duriaei CBS 260.36]